MEACVDVACIDGPGETRSRPQPRRPVAAGGELLQLRELDGIGAVAAGLVLTVLLGPVEGAVDEPEKLVSLARVVGRHGDARADGDRPHVLEIERRDPVDDRLSGGHRLGLLVTREEDRELVSAEAEGFTRLSQPCRDQGQNTVAGGMAEAVVDALEVVDVDEADAERAAVAQRVLELAGEALVKVAVVAKPRQRIREREADRAQRAEQRSLVELDREEWPDQCDGEEGRALPENDER